MFKLDARLEEDTVPVGQFELSLVLMHKDANYPWCILVPRREEVREIHHMETRDQIQLIKESSYLAEVMTDLFRPVKMNVAALGNQVPQLHVHHIARFREDPAWPKPIWGAVARKTFDQEALERRLRRLRSSLQGESFTSAS